MSLVHILLTKLLPSSEHTDLQKQFLHNEVMDTEDTKGNQINKIQWKSMEI